MTPGVKYAREISINCQLQLGYKRSEIVYILGTSTQKSTNKTRRKEKARGLELGTWYFSLDFFYLDKKCISNVAAFGAMLSTISSHIYFPALVPMVRDLDVSVSLINLTVTSYLVVAGIVPAFMGDFADQSDRRPAYMLMVTLVFCANIGLALQKSYPALLVLRMLQSAGASGSYGIIADITTTAERRSIFWFLVILMGVYLVFVLLFLPETQRKIVGNASIPTRGLHRSVFDVFTGGSRQVEMTGIERGPVPSAKEKLQFSNPFKPLPC
ncbi:hypothetical protein MCOR27_003567 [Pyricularia oryzae]|uniref:Major facilitator superfamily (MFS) profile domain-containing protein n=1 Tax=Pyricularia grisea TaxID=148305 RepID=A0ABQ8NJX3_PYRGI|nr:hypothetical protein MCOR01_001691 [Pyricularia oryzae]KAI6298176.1 hypothetical protein MCOR33_005635 [Pyricularia grisea]KAI6263065.1 hypothetical protein MCOR19_000705 [Pyricularia oryzae]KAI6281556.1 hypothetical protein MCOR26_003226 [Pyricularia oryzae]KAI6282803.1 hypothetical protein MCOR27_003567 [Pyricularia oryzae]